MGVRVSSAAPKINRINMNYKSISKKQHQSQFDVSLDKKEIESIISKKILEKQPTFEVSGFRKGKVPTNIIKSKIGLQIENEVLNEQVSKNITEITSKEKIISLVQPELEFKDNFNFKVSFYHKPKIDMANLKEVEVKTYVVDLEKKDIDSFRDKIRKEYFTLKEENKVTSKSVIDFEINNYSDDLKNLFSQKKVRIDLNTNTKEDIFLHLKKILIDCEVKQKIETQIKEKKLEITIMNTFKKIFPETDQELLKVLKIKDMNELNDQIKNKLNSDIDAMKKDYYIEELLKSLSEKKDINIHDDVINLELKRNYSINISDLKKEHQEKVDNLKKMLLDNLKKDVLYSELVAFFKVSVEQKELQEYIKSHFRDKIDQRTAEMAYATLLRNKIAIESMKAFKVKETKLSLDNFMKLNSLNQQHNHEHDHKEKESNSNK
ncbi:MAG: hypothetical protein CMI90_03980 [Pelagibacteraceae bacterium]|nr:hypothetical protein [Pelagibacteraceae bacterium]